MIAGSRHVRLMSGIGPAAIPPEVACGPPAASYAAPHRKVTFVQASTFHSMILEDSSVISVAAG
jgi:hypothetical protein